MPSIVCNVQLSLHENVVFSVYHIYHVEFHFQFGRLVLLSQAQNTKLVPEPLTVVFISANQTPWKKDWKDTYTFKSEI